MEAGALVGPGASDDWSPPGPLRHRLRDSLVGLELDRLREINELIDIAVNWRKELASHLTGINDEFLIEELEEDIETMMLPKLRGLTVDDNEYFKYGAQIWDETIILILMVRVAKLQRLILINDGYKPLMARLFYWMFYG